MIDPGWKHWYHAMHEECFGRYGDAFENYVTKVLKRLHNDFMNPDPMGSRGDGGCDGIADGGRIMYACYGQHAKTDADRKAKNKLESDFARALESWEDFTTWRFVTNVSMGPIFVRSFKNLVKQHAVDAERPIQIEIWDADSFWWKAVSQLDLSLLNQVMPGVPHAKDVELADLEELILSLEDVGGCDLASDQAIRPVPSNKMDFNDLGDITKAEFNEGRLLSARIDRWFSEQADPKLRDAKARRFRAIYDNARQVTQVSQELVNRIYGAVGGQDFRFSAKRANAVYAVTAYFFDSCDIFEEPPSEECGGDLCDVASY